jgi:HSF-type DNA-binding
LKVLSTTKHADVIAWTASGTAFEIRKPKQFVVDILPKYFKSAKYSSFTRKLHRWNFQRHYRGEEAGAFYHPEFLKDRLDMVEKMTCKLDGPASAPKAKPMTSKSSSSGSRTTKSKAKNGSGVRPPTQSRPLVTLNAAQVVGNYVPPLPPRPPVAQPTSANLSAAIELEVARRLEERISAATFSRQALAMLEQQQQQQQHIQATLNAMIERRFQALLSHQSSLAAVSPSANTMSSGSGRNVALPRVPPLAPASRPMNVVGAAQVGPMDLAQLYQKFKPAASYNYAFGDDTPALPPTNIQGARTA